MRAFAIRFVVSATLMTGLLAIAPLLAPRQTLPLLWSAGLVVGVAVVFAGVAHIGDQLSWNEHTFGHDERTWRQLLGLDREENRRRRQERRFGNSAVAGVFLVLLGVYWAGTEWWLDTGNPFAYLAGALFAGSGIRLVWAGLRRWRAGGEFNLPGRAGPVLREPLRETRGD